MNVSDLIVVLVSLVMTAALAWFFFGPRRGSAAEVVDGVQRVEVRVRGGYSPDVVRVRQGVPVEVVFDRQESGDCTSRVVFADFAVSAALPAFERTTVRLRPERAGSFGFACGMNMVHGTLVVEPAEAVPGPEAGAEAEGTDAVVAAPPSGTSAAPRGAVRPRSRWRRHRRGNAGRRSLT
jgi:Cu+-exporting ATPase